MAATAASITAGAAAGSGATAGFDGPYVDDTRGAAKVTTGSSGTGAGALCTITFASWAGDWATQGASPTGPYVLLTVNGTNTAGASLGTVSYQWNSSYTQLTIYCTGTPATSTAYTIAYLIVP